MMYDLYVCQYIVVVSSEGILTFSAVRTFLKKRDTITTTYKSISTSMNTTISLTANHLIYTRKTNTINSIPV